MIWDPEQSREADEGAVGAYVTAQIAEWCGEDGCDLGGNIAELAHAIECYLRQRPSGEIAGPRQMLGMASRALASIGEYRAARKLFVFGTGMAAPAEWLVGYGDSVLVLDLRQVTLCDDSGLELAFFANLDVALDSVAEFWDDAGGRGFLGLRHVCATARSLLGCVGDSKIRALVGEIKESCRARLDRLADARDWDAIPYVINLDIV